MRGIKVVKISLENSGCYLGREKGCLVVRNRKEGKEERYPLSESEVREVQIRSGNSVSAGALVSMAYWGIPLIVATARGNPVGVLVSFDNSSHVLTRIHQYESLKSPKALEIAKKFVITKLMGENEILKKYGLRRHGYSDIETIRKLDCENLEKLRSKLLSVEGHCTYNYFQQIFELLPEHLRPTRRRTFKAYDKGNNLFNVAYTVLSWKIHIALVKARLEPYLGYLHWITFANPALICDFQELYRYLLDDFVIQYAKKLEAKDFILKDEDFGYRRKGKREYLNDVKSRAFLKELDRYFESMVEVPRIRKGNRQMLETLINEEALQFGRYLRNEIREWNPRIVNLT